MTSGIVADSRKHAVSMFLSTAINETLPTEGLAGHHGHRLPAIMGGGGPKIMGTFGVPHSKHDSILVVLNGVPPI